MRPFRKKFAPYFIFNLVQNVSEILSRIEEGLASKVQFNDLGQASSSAQQAELVAAEMWERSAAVEELVR